MNYAIVFNVLGNLLRFLGLIMVFPLVVALYYGEPLLPFATSIVITVASGIALSRIWKTESEWKIREGFLIVVLGWLSAAIFGSIPFLFEGVTVINALFETMSGFTSTGATILVDIEAYSKSLLFWRSMTQWVGGMGIIVLVIAILPKLGVAGRQLFRAEAPGPFEDKIKPRIRGTAKILWSVYLVISFLEVMALLIAGLSLYDALTHTFSTMGCGGFSPYGDSIATFNSPLVEGIITFFMFIAGASFALHYRTFYSDRKSLINDEEFRIYALVVVCLTLIISLILWRDSYPDIFGAFRYGVFQIVSISTATGFATADFNLWSDSAKFIIIASMFVGGCSGSAAGGVKVVRSLLFVKFSIRELFRLVHPKSVKPITFNKKAVPESILQSIVSFLGLYLLLAFFTASVLAIQGMDIITSLTASFATIGNIGPGLNVVGPWGNFDVIPAFSKVMLIGNMLFGRLELFTVFVLLLPEFWSD
ncbi:TrkH family potassium uptake protein [Methanolobus chelungpuianus]|uniref:Potassium transporter n=1 Tax=Methanolobus chelungpuianus TaxID=502115 RepID=A0AAE3KXG9_9EURY|nr:TrkH family potassium uptake protein [Methanolobus chelungpuianus]MCQ6962961.1 potassium transporter [Methanolobus chelungpuianus]